MLQLRSHRTGNVLPVCIYVKNMHKVRRLIPTSGEIFMKRSLDPIQTEGFKTRLNFEVV